MPEHEYFDPGYPELLIENFKSQKTMRWLGANLTDLKPGYAEVTLPWREEFTQQSESVHGGLLATIADNAGGYAAWTLEPNDSNILAVEFKINLLAEAKGDPIIARGHVVKHGRTLTVSRIDIYSVEDGKEILCAIMQQTLICIRK
ncbi:MAG: PaaI family thioesterase [bacterium]|nr:PaaI family thioesterase [bacterium]